MSATVVANESNMGEGQVLKKVKCHILSPMVFTAGNDICCLGLGRASVGIVDRKGGYTS